MVVFETGMPGFPAISDFSEKRDRLFQKRTIFDPFSLSSSKGGQCPWEMGKRGKKTSEKQF